MQTILPGEDPTASKKTVLVVDDFASVRFYHANLLRQAGYRSIDARDGFEAFEKLRQQKIDLILLDMVMPKMSGDEFIDKIRAMPEYSKIPLLVITSEAVGDKIKEASGDGPLGFAMKPVVPGPLLEAVRKLIS